MKGFFMNWKKVISNSERYKDFTLLDKPGSFCCLFADCDIHVVQLHSTEGYETPEGSDIVGFCGAFQWIGNKLTPLDGDSYSETVLVLGYKWFSDKEQNLCLDILVGDDW